ncbi:penicillin-binding protein [Brevibacillus dissolubilis]|uniref:penicillin-binding protein n=1 Tax=Brevibacillus dissolubilis TaxID=1844116 RepID=UPI00111651B1|nr:PASTA domain-containing penicillin-binding protein [Brevibacillus dissolubilis]
MDTKKRVNWRILMLSLLFILSFMGLTMRLWWLQSVDAAFIIEKAKKQWEEDKTIKQKRGSILDRNGEVLAFEGNAYKVEAKLKPDLDKDGKPMDDDYIKDPFGTASRLAPILGVSPERLFKRLTPSNPGIKWVELGREASKITEEQRNKILDMQYPKDFQGIRTEVNQMPGIQMTETTRRYYPHNTFAPHVLGYLRYDGDEAKMGVEMKYDKELRGKEGELSVITDAAGYQLPEGQMQFQPAQDGQNVVLTIDRQIQDYVEQALDKTEAAYKPKKMTVLVTDPNTGEVLAMGNRPHFNPNQYWNIENFTNHAVSSMFEPGSTFKIITLAAAIQEGVFNQNDYYDSGSYSKIPGKRINDHNNGRGWGRITYLEGVQRSSNVAFVKMGYERLKQEKLQKYFKEFGFGSLTGIELPSEGKGQIENILNPRSPRDIAVTTFGQGVAVTAIQQVAAVGAIANGGEMLKPHIIKELRDPHTGAVSKRSSREVVRRVVSEKTAKEVRDILETVVTGEHGTGKAFEVPGYHVAGKTGTAQKYDDNNGKILEGRYIVSFIGFAPKDNPKLLVYVVVDDPSTDLPSSVLGGKVVAPIFTSVMEQSLKYLQQTPDPKQLKDPKAKTEVVEAAPVKEITMPELTGVAASVAADRAKKAGLTVELVGTGTKIKQQVPAAFEKVSPSTKVYLITDKLTNVKMPDFKGKSLREVMEFASLINMKVTADGYGFVSQQNIAPGTKVTGKETLNVKLVSPTGP